MVLPGFFFNYCQGKTAHVSDEDHRPTELITTLFYHLSQTFVSKWINVSVFQIPTV